MFVLCFDEKWMRGEQRGRGLGVGEEKRADQLGCGLEEWAVRGQGKKIGGKRLRFC